MSAQEIVEVVGELVVDDGETLEQQHGTRALTVAREMKMALAPRLQENEMQAMIWRQFRNTPERKASYLTTAVTELLSADVALAQKLDELLTQYQRATASTGHRIDTGGGAYVRGKVSVKNGDFVGRDKTTTTITGDGNVFADRGSTAAIKRTGLGGDEVAALFERALEVARQKPPEVRDDLEAAVEIVQEETEAGEDVNKRLLDKALDVLLEKGPDALEIVLEAMLNPAAAAGKGAKMLARHAKEKRRQAQEKEKGTKS
jgi:hypothetical protein